MPRSKLQHSTSVSSAPDSLVSKSSDASSRSGASTPNPRAEMRRTASMGSPPSGLPPRGTPVKASGVVSQPIGSPLSHAPRASYAAALVANRNEGSLGKPAMSFADHSPLGVGTHLSQGSSNYQNAYFESMSRPLRAQSEPTIQVVSLDSLIDDYLESPGGVYGAESFLPPQQGYAPMPPDYFNNPALYDRPASMSSLGGGELSRHSSIGGGGGMGGGDLSRTSSFSSQHQIGVIGSPSTSKDNNSYGYYASVLDDARGDASPAGRRDRSSSGGLGFVPSFLQQSPETINDEPVAMSLGRQPMTALMSLQQQHAINQEKLRQQQYRQQQQLLLQQRQQQQQLMQQQQQRYNMQSSSVPSPSAWASFVAAPQSSNISPFESSSFGYRNDLNSSQTPPRGLGTLNDDFAVLQNMQNLCLDTDE